MPATPALHSTFFIDRPDRHRVHVRFWASDRAPRGVLHWLHGMAEHAGRYGALASALNQAGWHLAVHDHRGHGQSVSARCPLGHFDDRDGWNRVVEDIEAVHDVLNHRFAPLPVFLGGHSMGSFLALTWAQRHAASRRLPGLILCGSDYRSPALYRVSLLPILLARLLRGRRRDSGLIQALTFGAWARSVPGRRTEFDWLSQDPAAVQYYMEDPLCGFACTTQLWHDLLSGLAETHARSRLEQLPATLPVLLLGGQQDPMSRHGQGMRALTQALLQSGLRDATLHEYDGRHEILNDVCREQVQQDLVGWLEARRR